MARNIRRLALVGAGGQMGGLFARTCADAGIEVRPLGRPLDPERVAPAVRDADLVLLSVPIPAMNATLDRVVPFLDEGAILADLCSVKVLPLGQMLKAYPGPVVGTHPLFGPVIPEGFTPRVAVVQGRDEAAAAAVTRLMEKLGYSPFACTAEEHDRAMAFVQGLNFTTTVAYLAALREVDEAARFVTPSLQRRLDSARKMITQDRELFAILAESNPFSQEAVRRFRALLSLAAGGEFDLLADQAGWWWREEQEAGRK